jgi:hypothetical protein
VSAHLPIRLLVASSPLIMLLLLWPFGALLCQPKCSIIELPHYRWSRSDPFTSVSLCYAYCGELLSQLVDIWMGRWRLFLLFLELWFFSAGTPYDDCTTYLVFFCSANLSMIIVLWVTLWYLESMHICSTSSLHSHM